MNEEDLFFAAMEKTGAERQAFLDETCGENSQLRKRIESLLESHESSDPFLRQPVLRQLEEVTGLDSAERSSARLGLTSSDGSAAGNTIPDALRKVLQPSDTPESLGRFSHFEILEILGCGGFGTVLKARDHTLRRLVAIKVLAPEQAISQRGRQRFLREARAAAAVRHDNVVVLYAVEELPIPHLVMELVTGSTLDDTSLTQANLIAGTPQYMSPEQAEGKRIDKRSDLFSLGSVLYAMCTRQAPFRAESTLAVLRHVCDREPAPIHECNRSIPVFLETIIQRLHSKHPEGRLQSAAEVAALLAQGLAEFESCGTIVSTVPNQHGPDQAKAGRSRQIHRFSNVTVTALVVMCIIVLIFVGWHFRDAAVRSKMAEVPVLFAQTDSEQLATRPNAADELNPAGIAIDSLAGAGNGNPQPVPAGLMAVLGQSLFPHALGPNSHSGIMDIAISRDNKYLATSNAVCSLTTNKMTSWEFKLWDFSTGRLIRNFEGLSDAVRAMDFNPQGTKLAVACDDGTLKVLNIADGQCLWNVAAHAGRSRAVDWSADGTRIVSGGDKSAAIWNADTAERLFLFDEQVETVLDVEFSSDGDRVLSTDGANTLIWQAADGKVLTRLPGGAGTMRSATFSRDNRMVIGGNIDSIGYIWDVESATTVRELNGHSDGVLDVETAEDGDHIATAGLDGTIRIWDISDGTEIHVLPGHLQHATAVAMTADGSILVAGDTRGRITLWNAGTGAEISDRHIGSVTSVAFSGQGDRLASAGVDGTVRVWDLKKGQLERKLDGRFNAANCVTMSPDGRLIAASGSQFIRIWHSLTGELLASPECTGEEILQIAFSPDGTTLASVSSEGPLRLWAVHDGTLRTTVRTMSPGSCLEFSPDGSFLAVGAGTEIRLFEMPSCRPVGVISGHTQPLRSIAFHPDGKSLVSSAAPDDSSVRIRELASRQEILRLEGHIGGAQVCRWRADGGLIVTCGTSDGTVQFWDLSTARPRRKVLTVVASGQNSLSGLALSPEGRFIATANADGTIFIIKLAESGVVFRVEN